MTNTLGPPVALHCHPASLIDAVRAIEVQVQREPAGRLAVRFRLTGDLARLRIPPPGPPAMVDGLWQHTCFEAFVAVDGTTAYHEFNFAPSGAWAAYTFHRYRERAPLAAEVVTPVITVHRGDDRIELDAVVRVDHLSPTHAHAPLRLALSAVVEDAAGALSYWALRHPPGQPDFHHLDGFTLRVEPDVGQPASADS